MGSMYSGMEEEADSLDEMDGGVHVDGFLQTIKIRRGWRAADVEGGVRTRRKGMHYRMSDGSSEVGGYAGGRGRGGGGGYYGSSD